MNFCWYKKWKPNKPGRRNGKQTLLLAIWGRMVAYSGQTLTLEQVMKSTETLGPKIEDYHWDLKWEDHPVALPGITKVILTNLKR